MKNFPSVFQSIKDLSKDQIDGILTLSAEFKNNDPAVTPKLFPNFTPYIALSFLENSTRTKHSFAIAAKKLGCEVINFDAESSSLSKGESIEETLKTLALQGVHLTVLRTSLSHQFDAFTKNPPLKLLNGGDGTHQHPSQALLDLFTMLEVVEDLNAKTVVIAGDLIHSRVGHSLIDLLPQFGAKVVLFGAAEFLPKKENLPVNVSLSHSKEEVLEVADFLYLLRIQKERHTETAQINVSHYLNDFGFSLQEVEGRNILVLHPGPANIGEEISQDLIDSKYYLGYQQVINSIFVRMAILKASLHNGDKSVGKINNYIKSL